MNIPAGVPAEHKNTYKQNFDLATHGTGKLMLFAGDQRVEHLAGDFFGEGISWDDQDPEHFFRIASQARIGCFAAHWGLVSRYAADYPDIPYLVKMNGKTNLVKQEQRDPVSYPLCDIDDVLALRDNGVRVVGIGYTLYMGSEFESELLSLIGHAFARAQEHGLLTVLWIYPRGKAVAHPKDPLLLAGATGLACSIGADFVKITAPEVDGRADAHYLKDAVRAAGRTGVIPSGGAPDDPYHFLQHLHAQLHVAGTRGSAVGRNVHQKDLDVAVRMCNAISAIIFDDWDVDGAYKIFTGEL